MSIETLRTTIDRHVSALLDICPAYRASIDEITMADYHELLGQLFHHVSGSSCTFAIAGDNLGPDRPEARDYLKRHAAREKSRWQWIRNDLAATRYEGPDPDGQFPGVETTAYLALSHYVAYRMPLAKLAIAAMLDAVSARLGNGSALQIVQALGLTPEETSFLLARQTGDGTVTEEIFDILGRSRLTEQEWHDVIWATEVAAVLYQRVRAAQRLYTFH
ncbi:MAG TPA: hypothetical protein VGU72_21200 [Beijerinckiaceae bacterium]|jgi:hypothetical protein|nr:hypothetical protein [Beijerinckiaceae bacterium]